MQRSLDASVMQLLASMRPPQNAGESGYAVLTAEEGTGRLQ